MNIYQFDGKTEHYFNVSRKLTGATGEDVNGIFNYISSSIKYGEYKKDFRFDKPLDIFNMSAQEYITEVLHRAQIVKSWIKTIDFKTEIEFEVD